MRVSGNAHRLTKVLMEFNQMKFIFPNSHPYDPHNTTVAVLGSHWSKKSSTADTASDYELFSLFLNFILY